MDEAMEKLKVETVKLQKIIAVLVLGVALSACAPRNFMQMPRAPEGPPEYQQGWADGCESGLSTYGNAFYKSFYKYRMDPNLRNNDIYYRTWNDSFHYCRSWAKPELAHGLTPTGGFGPRNDDPYYDLRDWRPAEQSGFTFPLWDNRDRTLPTFGDDSSNLWDDEDFDGGDFIFAR